MNNVALALDLLIRYTQAAQALATLINTARTEGRDISAEELLSLASADDVARHALDQAIITARAKEG